MCPKLLGTCPKLLSICPNLLSMCPKLLGMCRKDLSKCPNLLGICRKLIFRVPKPPLSCSRENRPQKSVKVLRVTKEKRFFLLLHEGLKSPAPSALLPNRYLKRFRAVKSLSSCKKISQCLCRPEKKEAIACRA
ncbi:hypothetical protein Barb4_01557 [Bacteroidales bacterium Barb4]|nr:hypothetical protein Barb4_01557 [Bacteroidales bacterium Barb4]